MTGYGRGVADVDGRRAVVELRSVNHRFLDVKLRGSALEPSVEDQVTAQVRSQCERGAVTATIRVEERGALAALRVDMDAARRVHAELAELAGELGCPQPIRLGLVCAQPGVMVPVDSESSAPAVWRCVSAALGPALDQLVAMRAAEGAALSADLRARLARLLELVELISGHAAAAPDEVRQRLSERLDRLRKKSGLEVDEGRLAQEVALIAERSDVTEELVRLRCHLDQAGLIMERDGAIGRRLEFMVQEIGREFNTVAAKSQSSETARAVVEAKAELEKIREQVQNIE